jgi:hypothetical protein
MSMISVIVFQRGRRLKRCISAAGLCHRGIGLDGDGYREMTRGLKDGGLEMRRMSCSKQKSFRRQSIKTSLIRYSAKTKNAHDGGELKVARSKKASLKNETKQKSPSVDAIARRFEMRLLLTNSVDGPCCPKTSEMKKKNDFFATETALPEDT